MSDEYPEAQTRLSAILSNLNSLSERDYEEAYFRRTERFRTLLRDRSIDAAVLTLGAEVPWMIGYEPMPLERITALIVRPDDSPTLLVPKLEAARVRERSDLFKILSWKESVDPYGLIVDGLKGAKRVAFSDRGWASWLLATMRHASDSEFFSLSELGIDIRREKDDVELLTLAAAGAAADAVAEKLLGGEVELLGKTEREVSDELSRLLLDYGHSRVNFAIVGSGPNSASPHHEPSLRVIGRNEPVVCDFGGTFSVNGEPGYCSDITRTVFVGRPDSRFQRLYEVLELAQRTARSSIVAGMSLSAADATARDVIDAAGYKEYFIHRLGHGIGLEEHEEPYLVSNATDVVRERDCFSVEPGIYVPGSYGARIEDIVTVEGGKLTSFNEVNRHLIQL